MPTTITAHQAPRLKVVLYPLFGPKIPRPHGWGRAYYIMEQQARPEAGNAAGALHERIREFGVAIRGQELCCF